jgi:hypothetical protein
MFGQVGAAESPSRLGDLWGFGRAKLGEQARLDADESRGADS